VEEIMPLQLEYGEVPKILFLGNGINRSFNFGSWDDLINSISSIELSDNEKKCLEYVPYPLRPIILTNDNLDIQLKSISESLINLRSTKEEEVILQNFASLPVDSILTSNYTYELEKAIIPNFKCIQGRRCKWRNVEKENLGKFNTSQFYTYYCGKNGAPAIWHIHGDASRPNTMVLGHYYYGKLLAKMQQEVSSFIPRYKYSLSQHKNLNIYSWIELFLVSDVYIVGFGMSLSELDIWWLVNCKKRHFPNSKIVLYKNDIKTEECLLANSLGVYVINNGYNGNYVDYYKWIYFELNKLL
jgi:hypothetical protein